MQHEAFGKPAIGTVQATAELRRIATRTCRRIVTDETAERFAEGYTQWLRKPGGTWRLHPHQAVALAELYQHRGLFAQIRAGGGKTLLGYLAPIVAQAARPVLLTKAALIAKTLREARELGEQFHIATWLRPYSYEALGQTGYYSARNDRGPILSTGLLQRLDPDMLVLDECHCLKDPKSARTKRVLKFLEGRRAEGRPVIVVAMSGTITNNSILDYAHLVAHTTPREMSFLPQRQTELWEWHKALDKGEFEIGALQWLGGNGSLDSTRHAYRDHMLSTPTVYATREGEVGSALDVTEIEFLDRGMHPAPVQAAYDRLRADWTLPDGHEIEDAARVWAHAQELALGFFSAHVPRPPQEWAARRSAWAKQCRHILSTNRRNLDSEREVTDSVDAGRESQEAVEILRAWREIEPTFRLLTEPQWLSFEVLDRIAAWLMQQKEPTLIWTHHIAVGEQFEQRYGVPYFGAYGLHNGNPIEAHRGHAIVSIGANRDGRNLQRWAHSLVLYPSINGKASEQLIARTHRHGQRADTVTVRALVHCAEHAKGLDKAIADARYQQDTTGQPMRLCYGNVVRDLSAKFARHPASHWQRER